MVGCLPAAGPQSVQCRAEPGDQDCVLCRHAACRLSQDLSAAGTARYGKVPRHHRTHPHDPSSGRPGFLDPCSGLAFSGLQKYTYLRQKSFQVSQD